MRTIVETYEFLCQSCDEPEAIYLSFNAINDERPVCPKCNTTFIPHLAFFRNLPTFRQGDITITPELANHLISRPFLSSLNEMDDDRIDHYQERMRKHQWVNATEDNGGELCPILLIDGTLLLGFNRLAACVRSGQSFINTIAEVGM